MMTNHSEGPTSLDGPNRRTFVSVLGALGTVGGVAAATAAVGAASAQTAADLSAMDLEVKRPANLGPRGYLDNRYAVTYQRSIPKGTEVLINFFAALNARDLKGMAEHLHFPFVTYEGTDAILVNTIDEFMAKTPASMNLSLNPELFTDHMGYIKKGSYDIIQAIEPVCFDPVLCCLSMTYDRFDSNGKRLIRCDGVYTVTNIEGKWGIEFMSTIFTPDMQVGITYADAEMWAHRLRIDHDLAYWLADVRYEPVRQEGASGSIANQVGQPWVLGPAGRAMEAFAIKGVKSRLRFSPGVGEAKPLGQVGAPARDMDKYYANYRASFQIAGDGNLGFVYGRLPNARIIHQSPLKVHHFGGAIRFTTQGELCSYNTDVGIVTYKHGRWGGSGNAAYTSPHDRSNDLMPAK